MAKPSASKKLRSKHNSSLLPSPSKDCSGAGVKWPAGGDGELKETNRLKKKPGKYVEESEVESGEEEAASEEEENGGSGSESGSESEPEESNLPDSSQPTKKPLSTPAISSAGVKRSAGGDGDLKETKRLKKIPVKYDEESEKEGTLNNESRKLFQRLWSEDDEIAILEGMIDFSAKKKADPFSNPDAFFNFIKKSLHVDASRSQLLDKIRKLRTKYKKNVDKKKKGKLWIFSNEHDKKAFDLSKKVWGNENSTAEGKFDGEVVIRMSKNTNALTLVNEEGKNLDGGDNGLEEMKCVSSGQRKFRTHDWIMENNQFVDAEKRAKMDEKWKNFKIMEGEFCVKKLELELEEAKLVLGALKSSGSS